MKMKHKKRKRIGIRTGIAAIILALVPGAYLVIQARTLKGYHDYTVQKEQYYVEYSDQYDYWDVITVEYPVLSGVAGDQAGTINKELYDMAMEQVDYWHLYPDEAVKELQEKYSIYSSDVRCEIPYHSQYLMSVHFQETYAPISPVYYVHRTQRGANINLLTGEQYELADIVRIDEDFMGLWCGQVEAEGAYADLVTSDADIKEAFLSWFLDDDEEAAEYYMFEPFFYLDEKGDFVIGISYTPKPNRVTRMLPGNNSFLAHFRSSDLIPYRTDSGFWELYEQSERAGEILECAGLQKNLWLGEDASIWDQRKRLGFVD